MHFIPETTASAGVEHLFDLHYYDGDTIASWEYYHDKDFNRSFLYLDVYEPERSQSSSAYSAQYATDDAYSAGVVELPDFLATRDLGLLMAPLAFTQEDGRATQTTSAFLLVLLKVLQYG